MKDLENRMVIDAEWRHRERRHKYTDEWVTEEEENDDEEGGAT